MNLLFVTQKVDRDDSVLSFTLGWVRELAHHFESVTVICLWKGTYDLPSNVKVLSLGKEKGISKISQGFNFFKYIWCERKNYDSILVHMNPIWAVLGGPFWRLSGKKLLLWYVHPKRTLKLRLALLLVNNILTSHGSSFPFKSEKVIVTGHGIDTRLFRRIPEIQKENNSILYVGRIAGVKNLDILHKAVDILKEEGVNCHFNIVGGEIRIANKEMPGVYNKNQVLVNLTSSGSFDKAILEAMACELIVVTTNRAFENIDGVFIPVSDRPTDIAVSLRKVIDMDDSERARQGNVARTYVVEHHNLETLMAKISNMLTMGI